MLHGHAKGQIIREELWAILQHGSGQTGQAYKFLSAILILLSIAILPLEFLGALAEYHEMLLAVEIVLTALFTVDYALHVYSAPHRLRYMFSFFGLVDLLSILPFFLVLFGTQYLRAFRLIRLLRFGEFEAAVTDEENERIRGALGLAEGERVEYCISRHPMYLLFNVLPTIVATTFGIALLLIFHFHPISITIATILLLFALIFLWRTWLNFSYDVIYITTHRLVFYDQFLLGRSINQVNYHAITNVQPSTKSILGYLLGYGLLTIETPATEQGHIELNIVQQHEKAAQIIMQKCLSHPKIPHVMHNSSHSPTEGK